MRGGVLQLMGSGEPSFQTLEDIKKAYKVKAELIFTSDISRGACVARSLSLFLSLSVWYLLLVAFLPLSLCGWLTTYANRFYASRNVARGETTWLVLQEW